MHGSGEFSAKFSDLVFEGFSEVKYFICDFIKFRSGVINFFPNLEAAVISDWKSNGFSDLGGNWKKLKYLDIQGFSGLISIFSDRDIRRLALAAPTLRAIDDVELFQNLEMLSIVAPRKGFDLSPIAKLPNLRYLQIEGRAKFTGWENFGSETVEVIEMSWLPDPKVLRNFPSLKFSNIWNFRKEGEQVGVWDDLADYPFGSVVPMRRVDEAN